jgi:hypothetical protein
MSVPYTVPATLLLAGGALGAIGLRADALAAAAGGLPTVARG